MAEVTFQDLDTLNNAKQDKISTVKKGIFSNADGIDGDFGICLKGGKYYFSVRVNGRWYFSEAKNSKDI